MFRPLTEQVPVVCEVKVTVSAELAVAFDANGVAETCLVPGLANVMV